MLDRLINACFLVSLGLCLQPCHALGNSDNPLALPFPLPIDLEWAAEIDPSADSLQRGDRSFHAIHQDIESARYRSFHPFMPVPDSPDQESIVLTEKNPIVAVIPELGRPSGYSSQFHSLTVNLSIVDNTITIDAVMDFFLASGNAVIGQNDYLLPLGNLAAGQYQVTVNKLTKYPYLISLFNLGSNGEYSVSNSDTFFTSNSYSFVVNAVPEPTSSLIMLTALSFLATQRRRVQATPHNAEASAA